MLGDTDSATLEVVDEVGRKRWGFLRIRRQKNPDFIVIEAAQDGAEWKPLMHVTAVDAQLLFRGFGGIHGRSS